MKTSIVGKTGIGVTELGHGTLIFGCLQARLPTEEGAAALRRFLDDTGARGQVVIATKSHAKTRDAMATAIDETLRELRLERVV